MSLVNSLRHAYRSIRGPRLFSPYEVVERAEKIFYLTYLRPGMTVFDVGANVGELTILFSKVVAAGGEVHAFEPNPTTFSKLESMCKIVGRKNILLNEMAVSDHPGKLQLHLYEETRSTLSTAVDRPPDRGLDARPVRTVEVDSLTLDQYVDDRQIETLDLLKIDVEGLEYRVMQGAQRLFAERRIRACAFEFGTPAFDAGVEASQIESFLESHSYRALNVIQREPAFPGSKNSRPAPFSMMVARPA